MENKDQTEFKPGEKKPEELYDELDRLGTRLKIPILQTHVSLVSKDKEGKVVQTYDDRSRSWLRNFWNYYFSTFAFVKASSLSALFQEGRLHMKNNQGTISHIVVNTASLVTGVGDVRYKANAGDLSRGIIVGTGSAAESFEDYLLDSVCGEGTGTNQFNYQTVGSAIETYSSGSKVWTAVLSRQLNNNSASTIGINEMGLMGFTHNNGSYPYLFCRDKLGATVNVLAAGLVTASYVFTMTFPA